MPSPDKIPKPCALRQQFGTNLKTLRKSHGFTQEGLSERAEISVRYLQSVESGEYWPNLRVLSKIRIALDVDWNQLLSDC